MQLLWVSIFGLTGVWLRFLADQAGARIFPGSFPAATLMINTLGSLVAGAFYAWLIEKQGLAPELRTGLLVGLLGGFTTFSAYSLQSWNLLRSGETAMALTYWIGSPVLGLIAAALGYTLIIRA